MEIVVVYFNIDVVVSGLRFSLDVMLEFYIIGIEIMKKVVYFNVGGFNIFFYDVWQRELSMGFGCYVGVLGSGSDYIIFLYRGVSVLDVGLSGGVGDFIWYYYSNYDFYNWMFKFGDLGFKVYVVMGQYLSLFVLYIVDDEILFFDFFNYIEELRGYYEDLRDLIGDEIFDIFELVVVIDVFEKSVKQVKELEILVKIWKDENLIKVVNKKY